MSTGVKICGLKTLDSLETAINAGATHFGLVFFPPSPRYIEPEKAAPLAEAARSRIISVALMVDLPDARIEHIVNVVQPDMIQLHGQETPDRVAQIRKNWERPVIKSIGVRQEGDAEYAMAYEGIADLILFDAKPPADGSSILPGGNGLAFDWRLIVPLREKLRFMLSGGLKPENVAEAIALTGADVVDVSSGVERVAGEKDNALIRDFVSAAAMAGDVRNIQAAPEAAFGSSA